MWCCPYLAANFNFFELRTFSWSPSNGGSRSSVREGRGGGGGYPDPEIRWGPGVQKVFFRPFGPQFSLKISGGPGPPRPLPWIRLCQVKLKLGTFYPFTLKAGSKYAYITLARKNKPNNQTNKPHSSHLGVLTQ